MKVIGRAVKRGFCLCELVRQVCIEPVVEGSKLLILLHLQPENTAIAGAGWKYRPAYIGERQVKSPDAVGKMVEEGLDRGQIRHANWLLERDVRREDACVQAGAVGPVDGERQLPDEQCAGGHCREGRRLPTYSVLVSARARCLIVYDFVSASDWTHRRDWQRRRSGSRWRRCVLEYRAAQPPSPSACRYSPRRGLMQHSQPR